MLHNILKRSLFASVVISFVLFWADKLNEQLNFFVAVGGSVSDSRDDW